MIHIGVFDGIGGFSLAAKQLGWRTLVICEIADFPTRVLQYHFPEAYHHRDIKDLTYDTVNDELTQRYGAGWRNDDIVITGGFPCQPFSLAGQRRGADDDRFLWPEFKRFIAETRPRAVLLENVAGLTSILQPASLSEMENKAIQLLARFEGKDANKHKKRHKVYLEMQNIVQKRILAQIVDDLNNIGYTLPKLSSGEQIVCCVPACAVNAPHRRDRLWIAGFDTYANHNGPHGGKNLQSLETGNGGSKARENKTKQFEGCTAPDAGFDKDPHNIRRNGGISESKPNQRQQREFSSGDNGGIRPNNGETKNVTHPNSLRLQTQGTEQQTAGFTGSGTQRIVAHPNSYGQQQRHGQHEEHPSEGWQHAQRNPSERRGDGIDTHPECIRQQGQGRAERPGDTAAYGEWQASWAYDDDRWPTEPPLCGGNDGFSNGLDGVTFSGWRTESIKGYGNAIVPQVGMQMMAAIQTEIEHQNHHNP